MPYAGFYALPTIVVGEFFLWLIGQGIVMGQGGGFWGMIIGPIVLLILIGIVCVALPFVGYLLYILIMFMIIICGVVGSVIGLGLGIACGIAYLLTRWASSFVASIACAILGGIAGYIAATWASNLVISWGEGWNILNYIALVLTGIIGGILFVAVADDTELGSRAQERAVKDSQNAKTFSPISMYIKAADYFKSSAEIGERYK